MFSKRAKVLISPLLLTLFSLGLLTPSSFGAGTPNFGYFGYTWITPAIAEFEVSPPIVSETVKEYQLAASYSLSACSNQTGAAQSCSYSALETFKTLSPSSLSNYGDITINSSTGVSTTYRSVKKFQITASEMQKFLSSKTSERNRNLAFSIRAIYGNTSTEWSDRTVATSSQIWGSSNSTSEKSVTIGYQGPLTGPEAVLGQDQLAAVRYVVANFNREYVGRYKVSIVEIDDQGDPAVAANIAPGVAQNSKILALVGPAYSGATLASLPSYKNASLGMISPSAIRESLTDPSAPAASQGSPVFHRISPLDRNQGVALYKLATAGVTSPKIFVVDDKSDYSQSLSKNVRNAITVGQLVGVDSIDTKNTDWSPTVMKSKVSGANVIIYTGYFAQAVE